MKKTFALLLLLAGSLVTAAPALSRTVKLPVREGGGLAEPVLAGHEGGGLVVPALAGREGGG